MVKDLRQNIEFIGNIIIINILWGSIIFVKGSNSIFKSQSQSSICKVLINESCLKLTLLQIPTKTRKYPDELFSRGWMH